MMEGSTDPIIVVNRGNGNAKYNFKYALINNLPPFLIENHLNIIYSPEKKSHTELNIKYNLINFFLTNQPERYLNPTFGGNLRAFIFQQIAENNVSALKQDIQSQLNLYFPNVAVANLSIDSIPDSNQINVSLTC